jgi:hypothetical protein
VASSATRLGAGGCHSAAATRSSTAIEGRAARLFCIFTGHAQAWFSILAGRQRSDCPLCEERHLRRTDTMRGRSDAGSGLPFFTPPLATAEFADAFVTERGSVTTTSRRNLELSWGTRAKEVCFLRVAVIRGDGSRWARAHRAVCLGSHIESERGPGLIHRVHKHPELIPSAGPYCFTATA